MKKYVFLFCLFLLGIAYGAYYNLSPKFPIITGYAAKKACSCHFIAQRDLSSIEAFDLNKSPLKYASLEINPSDKSVNASILGLSQSTAKYVKGLGCHLVSNNQKPNNNFNKPVARSKEIPLKTVGFNSDKINEALLLAFDKNNEWEKQTRALIVLKNDSIIAEKYAPGFDKNTKILGWSMTKSITNALIGILVKKGQLKINKTGLFEEWLDDKRRNISIDHLLRMNSGLEWEEDYKSISPATKMLFQNKDMGQFALSKKLEFDPGSYWEYSSGTTNILSKLIRKQFNSQQAYLDFPYVELFNKLGIASFELETDASGHYVLSSYCYGTPRDWAKMGMLYANNGVVEDDSLFTQDWVAYSTAPTSNSENGKYGAHFWLNTNQNELKDLPSDIYKFSGFEGQYVYIIPSKDIIVVRMGLSKGPPFDINGVMKLIYEAVD